MNKCLRNIAVIYILASYLFAAPMPTGHVQNSLLGFNPLGYSVATNMLQASTSTSLAKYTITDLDNSDLFVNFKFNTSGYNVFLVYTTDGIAPTKTNGISVSCASANTTATDWTWKGTIPSTANVPATTVKYVFYTSLSDLASAVGIVYSSNYATTWNEGEFSFSYFPRYTSSVGGGNWSSTGSWTSSVVPNASTANVELRSAVTLDGPNTVGVLQINSGGTFNGGSSTLTVNSIVNQGTFTAQTGTISFTTSGSITGTTTFYNIQSGSADLTLNNPISVTHNFAFSSGSSGKVQQHNNSVTIASGATITNHDANKYFVNGPSGTSDLIVNSVSGAQDFPVGTPAYYNLVQLNNSGTANNFTIRIKPDPAFTNTPVNKNAVLPVAWNITSGGAGSNVSAKLFWNTFQENLPSGASGPYIFTRGSGLYIGNNSGSGWSQSATSAVSEAGTGTDYYSASASGFALSALLTEFGLGNNGALPVELTSFVVSVEKVGANLQWSTATEVNNYGFDIERKSKNSWNKIGFVEGHGTTNSPQSYSYVDKSAIGKATYRLKQIDRDGKIEYSKEVEVTIINAPKEFALAQNYPNPFNPSTVISYQIPVNGHVSVTIYDALGREVALLVNETKVAGNYSVTFDASKLSSGIYFAKLQSGDKAQLNKMMYMK